MPIETLIFGPRQHRTSYSPRQLRNKLTRLRAGLATHFAAGTEVMFPGSTALTREQILAAIDDELAAFEALDALLRTVREHRLQLQARLPLHATAINVLTVALTAKVGTSSPIRPSLGLAPNKRPRKLKVAERLSATAKLNQTRTRNRTSERLRRRRKR